MAEPKNRETLSSRLGFLLLAAGCAIGLGNIWRFPFIVGQYGGGAFVVIYLFFLIFFGLPIMVMELAVGRGSRCNLVDAYMRLAHCNGTVWRRFGLCFFCGNLLLLMFYSTVTGWMPAYAWYSFSGALSKMSATDVTSFFSEFTASPASMMGWMAATMLVSTAVCAVGLRRGVERVVKLMMGALFLMMLTLCVCALQLPKAGDGLSFYFTPSWSRMMQAGIGKAIMAAMGQAFFTLSLGIGSMAIFGSYTDRSRTLLGEGCGIVALDTTVALLSGVLIFPACASFGVSNESGPKLVFITLPNIFNQLKYGNLWGGFFFLFMSLAALTTVIAVLENLVAFSMERLHLRRVAAALSAGGAVTVLSVPCALGFNVLSHLHPLGGGSNILDFEDFLVSNNLLPLGSLFLILFCTWSAGWGRDAFLAEANAGKGIRLPRWTAGYARLVIVPVIVLIFFMGYINLFW